MKLKYRTCRPGTKAPLYAHKGDSGADVFANFNGLDKETLLRDNTDLAEYDVILSDDGSRIESVIMSPLSSLKVSTGLIPMLPGQIRIPYFYGDISSFNPWGNKGMLPLYVELQVRPKSGRAYKERLTVTNTPGTVDNHYQGEIQILLSNLSASTAITILQGQKVAQVVPSLVPCLGDWEEAGDESSLVDAGRGVGGFGSTGL